MIILNLLVLTLLQIVCASQFTPWAVRLAYGDNQHELVVTWSTNATCDSVVEYGINNLEQEATGVTTIFRNPTGNKQQYLHRVRLSGLEPNSKYIYRVGNSKEWSKEFWFKTPPAEDVNWSPLLCIYGDLGVQNAKTLPYLVKEVHEGLYDAVLHIGDFAYDMNTDHGDLGDKFLKLVEPMTAYVPFMTTPGNHEQPYNFSHYRNLFSMPGGTESMMYSYNVGPIHIISVSTEFYYYLEYGMKPLVNQFMWLEQDLEEATSLVNRTKHPWIIMVGHRPMYCDTTDRDDCVNRETRTRVGLPILGRWMFGLEDMLDKYGVDLTVWAHEHNYERLWPLSNYTVYNGSKEEPYRNPNSAVHITTGSAGCKEGVSPFLKNPPEWSAFRSLHYGYARVKVYNSSHLYMEQVSENEKGKVIDSFWLIKDHHGPYKRQG